MHEAIPKKLWFSNARDARQVAEVLQRGVLAVIDLSSEEPIVVYPRDILYCRIPLVDGAGNRREFVSSAVTLVASFIESGTPTLVCCGGGMSRSPLIVASALAKSNRIPLKQALERITDGIAHDVSTSLLAEVIAICE